MDKTFCIHELRSSGDFPGWLTPETLARLLYEWLKPYEDTVADIMSGIESALAGTASTAAGDRENRTNRRGSFILVAGTGETPVGALVMLNTGMKGYVPENLLLFVAVDPSRRGKGIGSRLVQYAVELCEGNVKLHVEYDNPAKGLYEHLGFTNKYAEMRYEK